jgi:hypothetical protein
MSQGPRPGVPESPLEPELLLPELLPELPELLLELLLEPLVELVLAAELLLEPELVLEPPEVSTIVPVAPCGVRVSVVPEGEMQYESFALSAEVVTALPAVV